jgi:hypothetical protein
MYNGINSNSEKHRLKAVQKVVDVYLGLVNSENVKKEEDNLFSHTNTRGRKRYFRVFISANTYNKWFKENQDKEQKLHKALGYYIVELKKTNKN